MCASSIKQLRPKNCSCLRSDFEQWVKEAGSEWLDGKGDWVCMCVGEEEGNSQFPVCGRAPRTFVPEYSGEESRTLLLCPEVGTSLRR